MRYSLHRRKDENDLEHTTSHVQDDGRVNITFKPHAFLHRREQSIASNETVHETPRVQSRRTLRPRKKDFPRPPDAFAGVPRMNVAILITGSRGDVQPFIALGQALNKPPYSHRVRICTHPVFKDFVEGNGLEFFSIGGDPAKLMAYMVKNPGIIPSMESIRQGDIGARKADLAEMLEGAWRGCTQGGDGMTQIDHQKHANDEDVLMSYPMPFVADAIIANPPTYAHIHIAEKLGVPLHLMFTMPWSPTGAFPHPLANLSSSNADAKLANYFSYSRMEFLTWEVRLPCLGVGDMTFASLPRKIRTTTDGRI